MIYLAGDDRGDGGANKKLADILIGATMFFGFCVIIGFNRKSPPFSYSRFNFFRAVVLRGGVRAVDFVNELRVPRRDFGFSVQRRQSFRARRNC